MSTDLDAAVARLREGVVRSAPLVVQRYPAWEVGLYRDIARLLADWERLRSLDQPGLPEAMQKVRAVKQLTEERDAARAEVERLREKLSNTRTTCAYCEAVHELPCTFDDIRAHVEQCPKHPMAALKGELARLREHHEEMHDRSDECASLQAELARLRERDARVRELLDVDSRPSMNTCADELRRIGKDIRSALALLKETP